MIDGCSRVKSLLRGADWEEKCDQLRIYSGEKYQLAETVQAGMVCAATGLSHTTHFPWRLPRVILRKVTWLSIPRSTVRRALTLLASTFLLLECSATARLPRDFPRSQEGCGLRLRSGKGKDHSDRHQSKGQG